MELGRVREGDEGGGRDGGGVCGMNFSDCSKDLNLKENWYELGLI